MINNKHLSYKQFVHF